MKKKMMFVAAFAGLVMAAGAAQADGHRQGPDFATLDADGDGQLTLEELQAQGEARFATADTDGNGALSAEELIAAANGRAEERAARMIERLDANGDGVLQQDELRPRGGEDRAQRLFERADADENGAISEEEFETARDNMRDRMKERREDRRERNSDDG